MTDLEHTLAVHQRVVEAFSGLLRTVPSDTRVPHLAWTVGELGAHVLGGVRDYERAAIEGVDVWADLREGSAENARQIERTPEREASVIADRLPPATASLHEAWRRADDAVRWSAGLSLPVVVVAGIHLADVLVHGWDLARAAKMRWHIDRRDAVLALHAAATIAPHFVAPAASGFSGVYEVRLRSDGRLIFAFADGSLHTDRDTTQQVDCRLSADPVSFLLSSYGRIPVWRAALTGAVVATGRKPWLAFRFKSLLMSP